jgi:hypothetical protein
MDDKAQVLIKIATSYIDVGTGHDQERYLEILSSSNDWGDDMQRYFKAGPSTCGLFARGVLRMAGVKSDLLTNKYVIGQAVADIVAIAHYYDAWVLATKNPDKFPTAGDIWIINNPGANNEHVGLCVSDSLSYYNMGYIVNTVEGGQVPNSSYIRKFTRRFLKSNNNTYMLGTRVLWGWVDHTKLPIPTYDPEYARDANMLAFVQHVLPDAIDRDSKLDV